MHNHEKLINRIRIHKRFKILGLFFFTVAFTLVFSVSYSVFSNRTEGNVANIKVANMEFNMSINGNLGTIINSSQMSTTKSNIVLLSLNDLDSKYEIVYKICTSAECNNYVEKPEGLIIEYSSRTIDTITGTIVAKGSKSIRIIVTNNTNSNYYIKLEVNAGYIHNTLTLNNLIISEYNEEDLKINVTVNGIAVTEMPTTQSDYESSVNCNVNGSPSNSTGAATWNGTKWIANITGLDTGQTVCTVEFYKTIKNQILSQGGGAATIEARGTPNFANIAPAIQKYKESVRTNIVTNISSGSNKVIGSGYTFNTTTGLFNLTNYLANQSYESNYIGYYTCNNKYYSGCVKLYKILTVSGTSLTKYDEITAEIESYDYSENGLYAAEDDYSGTSGFGKSYYYRGDKDTLNNNLIFGGFQWKIIRINGNGSVRLIYNGTKASFDSSGSVYVGGSQSLITSTVPWNDASTYDAKLVGYMFGGAISDSSTVQNGVTSSAATYNQTSSGAKSELDMWYAANILGKPFESSVIDSIFCNDRSLYSGTGYGTGTTYFGAYNRLTLNKSPSLKCINKNDRFTVNDTLNGNGNLQYPIGLVTGDELAVVGMLSEIDNFKNYLQITGYNFMSMTPYSTLGSPKVVYIHVEGGLSYLTPNNSISASYRPVISIAGNVRVTGTGSSTDPFIAY